MQAAGKLAQDIGVSAACRALGVPRSTLYRKRQPRVEPSPRPTPPRALSVDEKAEVRSMLNSERFYDRAPREVYATLLDVDGIYYCHWRTMYRILAENEEVHERRNQCQRPKSPKPELKATGPNQLWSWDITRLAGPRRVYYYLYMIIDVFSRYIVGWMIAHREEAGLAKNLIANTCNKQGIEPNQLIIHSDRGSSMRSKTVTQLYITLGITKSHSRPYTPTDNPYSEAQFKTMKYQPDYPGKFDGIGHSRDWTREFVRWCNYEHHHVGLALMTPAVVHYGQAKELWQQRQEILKAAYETHPDRFVRGKPIQPKVPEEVWINPPEIENQIIELAVLTAGAREPGSQAGAKEKSEANLNPAENLAILEPSLEQYNGANKFFPKLLAELS